MLSGNSTPNEAAIRWPTGELLLRLGAVCQPALSSPSTMTRSRPAPASRANSASSAAKNGLDTPFDTYQNVSPEMLWGGRWRDGTIVAGSNAMERPMAQQLDD